MLLAASGFVVAPALVLARGTTPRNPPRRTCLVTGLGRLRRGGGGLGCCTELSCFAEFCRLAQPAALGPWMNDRIYGPSGAVAPGLLRFAGSLAAHWRLEANLQLRLRIGADNAR